MHHFPIPFSVKYNIKMRYSHFYLKKKNENTVLKAFRKFRFFENSIPIFTKIIFVQDVPRFFLVVSKHFGLRKRMNTGFYGFENPEIMKTSSFDV